MIIPLVKTFWRKTSFHLNLQLCPTSTVMKEILSPTKLFRVKSSHVDMVSNMNLNLVFQQQLFWRGCWILAVSLLFVARLDQEISSFKASVSASHHFIFIIIIYVIIVCWLSSYLMILYFQKWPILRYKNNSYEQRTLSNGNWHCELAMLSYYNFVKL